MSTAIAIRPTYSPADIANARAYALSKGERIGTKGRVPNWALTMWDDALRPSIVKPKARYTPTGGKRGGPSTVTVDGNLTTVSKAMGQNARAWAIENGHDVPVKGRLRSDIIQDWVNAGMPEYREEVATVYYRKRDKRGRLNGPERIAVVYRDMMPTTGRGRPPMSAYWDALGIDGVPIRITTNAMIINVSVNDDDTLSYEWVSKSDSKAVVTTLLANVSMR